MSKLMLRKFYVLHFIFFFSIVYITGILNSIFIDLRPPDNLFMIILGHIMMLLLGMIQFFILNRYFRSFKNMDLSAIDKVDLDFLKKRMEMTPLFMFILMVLSNIIGPPIIALIMYMSGIQISSFDFTAGLTVIGLVAIIFIVIHYIVINYQSFLFTSKFFLKEEEKTAYARKHFLSGTLFLVIISGALFPVFMIFVGLSIFHYQTMREVKAVPSGVFVILGLFSVILFGTLLYLYIKTIIDKISRKSISIEQLPESFFRKLEITGREKEIIELVIKGHSNNEIAEELFVSLPTVKNHLSHIYRKTSVNNRTQLIHLLLSGIEE